MCFLLFTISLYNGTAMKELLSNSIVSSTYSFMIDDIGHWLCIYLKARVDILRVLQSPFIKIGHLVPRTNAELSH